MANSVFVNSLRQQAQIVDDESERWMHDHKCAMQAWEAQDFAQACIILADSVDKGSDYVWKTMVSHPKLDHHAFGKALVEMFDAAFSTFDKVSNCIDSAKVLGYTIDNEAEFHDALRLMQGCKAGILGDWPWSDAAKIERADEEYRSGRFAPLKDFINELRSGDPGLSLRALLTSNDGYIEAQMLELDIAVRASSLEGVLEEFQHAIIVLCRAARKLGVTPFANISRAPQAFHAKWQECGGGNANPAGSISLPEDVAEALATALRANRPLREVPIFKLAAAA